MTHLRSSRISQSCPSGAGENRAGRPLRVPRIHITRTRAGWIIKSLGRNKPPGREVSVEVIQRKMLRISVTALMLQIVATRVEYVSTEHDSTFRLCPHNSIALINFEQICHGVIPQEMNQIITRFRRERYAQPGGERSMREMGGGGVPLKRETPLKPIKVATPERKL